MSASRKPVTSGHMIQLDGLRALAAIAVVAQHTIADTFWVRMGAWQPRIGVRLFFVLSGFLITGILLKVRDTAEGLGTGTRHAFAIFYARRFLRIFPLYYVVLFGAAIAGLPEVRETFFWHLTYLSNSLIYKTGRFPETLGHFWSLAVEEQFYIVWPAFVLLAPRKLLGPAFVALIFGSILVYLLVLKATGNWISASVITPSNLDTLSIGGLLALIHAGGVVETADRFRDWSLRVGGVLAILAIGLAATGRGWTAHMTLAQAANALLFAWLVDGAARGFGGVVGRALSFRPLRYIGTISYGLYIYHLLIPEMFQGLFRALGLSITWPRDGGLHQFGWTMVGSIAVAALSWHLFEKPLNDLKRYFPYPVARRSPARDGLPEPAISANPGGIQHS